MPQTLTLIAPKNDPAAGFVQLLLCAKGLNCAIHTPHTGAIELCDRSLTLQGLYPVYNYIDERYPPHLIEDLQSPLDPAVVRAWMRHVIASIYQPQFDLADFEELITAQPFLHGTSWGILDLALLPRTPTDHTTWSDYRKRVMEAIQ